MTTYTYWMYEWMNKIEGKTLRKWNSERKKNENRWNFDKCVLLDPTIQKSKWNAKVSDVDCMNREEKEAKFALMSTTHKWNSFVQGHMNETPTINPATKSQSKCETKLPKKTTEREREQGPYNVNKNPRVKYTIFVKTTTTICSVGNNTHINYNNINKYIIKFNLIPNPQDVRIRYLVVWLQKTMRHTTEGKRQTNETIHK